MRGMRWSLPLLALPLVLVMGPALSYFDALGSAVQPLHAVAFANSYPVRSGSGIASSHRSLPSAPRKIRLHKRYHHGHDDYVIVTWAAPYRSGKTAITAYRVIVRDPHSNPRVFRALCNGPDGMNGIVHHRRCVDQGDDGDRIRFAVRAHNRAGWGPRSHWSKPISLTPVAA